MKSRGQRNKFLVEFGTVVRRHRHKLAWSQEVFAEKAAVHRTYVSSIELGKDEVGIGVARNIANALGISLNVLIREVERA